MARSNRFLPREGFYIDPLFSLLKITMFNPFVTGPLWLSTVLVVRFADSNVLDNTPYYPIFARLSTILLYLSIFGTLLYANDYLSSGALNNWTHDDTWDWDKEIVVITGSSSGIGASLVQQLLSRNPKTTIVDVDIDPPTFPVASDARFFYMQCDLSDSEAIRALAARVRTEVGAPTVLVNNAGLGRGRTVVDGSYHDVELTFRTNIIAPFLLTKEFLPDMLARNHGHVVAISSLSAIAPPAGLADYAATKAGLLTLQEALRQEVKFSHGAPRVRVSSVVLSFVGTPMFRGRTRQSAFIAPLVHVDTVGERIADVLHSGRAAALWLPGIARLLGSLRGAPDWVLEGIRNATQKLEVDFRGRQTIDPRTGRLVHKA